MSEIKLGYGQTAINFPVGDSFTVLAPRAIESRPLNDVEVGAVLDNPIDSPPLDEVVGAGESVLIVVSDATRATASAQIVNLLVRRLIQSGVSPHQLAIIFATGIHRPVSDEEKSELLTPFIKQRINILDHDPDDAGNLLHLGTTGRGVPAEVNAAVRKFDHIILTGAIGFHYFAGFTGGRKSICPGLASRRTITATHLLAFDFEKGGRRDGVGAGVLQGNAVHEECESVAEMVGASFGIYSVVNSRNQVLKLYGGDWRAAHRAGCADYLLSNSIDITGRRDLVVASCGGSPYDINLIQAHKTLETAAQACLEGGSIILLAECADGLGRANFLDWFSANDSQDLERLLRENYEVNGQTAWSLLRKTELYRVILVSSLPADAVIKMRMIPAQNINEAMIKSGEQRSGFVIPGGAAILPRVNLAN